MARFVSGGPIASYIRQNPNISLTDNFEFFQNKIIQAYGANSELGQTLISKALANTEVHNGFAAVASAKAAAAQVSAMMNPEAIRYLNTVQDFQTAPLTMVNWIMTDPVLRKHYHNGYAECWSDTYVDLYPHETGENSAAYMLLNNGLFMEDEQNGWKYFNYGNIVEGFEPLTIYEVDAIKLAQARLAKLIEQGEEDPTSQYGRMLG